MAIRTTLKIKNLHLHYNYNNYHHHHHNNLHQFHLQSIPSPSKTLQESIKSLIQSKTYHQIPNLLTSTTTTTSPPLHLHAPNNNDPFSFLSSYTQPLKTQIIDSILQSFIPLRPRFRLHSTYTYLLSFTLQDPNPFPISLAILQRTLRSGSLPPPQTHLSLSSAWVHRRRGGGESTAVSDILSEMRSIGYRPDCGTVNYLIESLCAVDELEEAVKVLEGMGGGGCEPDSESYTVVILAMCKARRPRRRTNEVVELVRKMSGNGVVLRLGALERIVKAMRANGEVKRAAEMVRWLDKEGNGGGGGGIGFKVYEMVVEGCLEKGEFVLAGEVVMDMADKGFIPYVAVRQKVVDRLVGIGKPELARRVRQKLATLKS